MTVYADWTYYSATYLGTAITEANFPRLALRASEVIDQITFDRAADDTDNETAIKNATCAVAEEIQKTEQRGGADAIVSESLGSHSVTYAGHSTMQMSNVQRYQAAASRYLGSTGLMFSGFSAGEYSGE